MGFTFSTLWVAKGFSGLSSESPSFKSFYCTRVAFKGVYKGYYKESLPWALEYHALILFFLKESLWNTSLYLFLPGYLNA